VALLFVLPASAQYSAWETPHFAEAAGIPDPAPAAPSSEPVLNVSPVLPRMAPELALETFETRTARQNAALESYSATTVIRAELPETKQQGEFELKRVFTAPKTLLFKALQFTGDTFVKTNVITRLLQSEVEHVEKQDPASTALSGTNYKFSYKGTKEVDGKLAHIFQLKPRKKRVGLIKGRLWLDARTGSLVRLDGAPAKSPSLFLRKIQFVQDYADFGAFTFPVHVHSEAKASIVGRTIVDIYHSDYQVVANAQTARLPVVVAGPIPSE
jgi:outer membrane lipoprotein-sorting protein